MVIVGTILVLQKKEEVTGGERAWETAHTKHDKPGTYGFIASVGVNVTLTL
jgi:hypothetical protein